MGVGAGIWQLPLHLCGAVLMGLAGRASRGMAADRDKGSKNENGKEWKRQQERRGCRKRAGENER